jgi:hypothetical protein
LDLGLQALGERFDRHRRIAFEQVAAILVVSCRISDK